MREHEWCVYPRGQRCRGADRCQFPSRCGTFHATREDGDLRRQDFVVDDLGMVHHVENYRRLQAMASPAWRSILGPGRPLDAIGALDFVIRAAHDADRAKALDRWADDGGAP